MPPARRLSQPSAAALAAHLGNDLGRVAEVAARFNARLGQELIHDADTNVVPPVNTRMRALRAQTHRNC